MLDGITVVEAGNVMTAPKAARLLAEFGAEVIKVERPSGTGFRRGPFAEDDEDVTFTFVEHDRGKKSIGIDLASEEGAEAFRRLARDADVIVENQAPGRMEKFGVGYEDIRAINEEVIYCSISGYGDTGPYADKKGMDFMVQAFTGLAYQNAIRAGVDEPILTGMYVADQMTAAYAAMSIVVALVPRTGTYIDVSMTDVFVGLFEMEAAAYSDGRDPLPPGASSPDRPYRGPMGTYHTATDPMAIYMFGPDPRQLRKLWDALGLDEWVEEDRFLTVEEMDGNEDFIESTVVERFESKPREYWLERFWERDLIAGPFHTIEEAFEHEQFEDRQVLSREVDERLGEYLQTNYPAMYSGHDVGTDVPAPSLGEHTRELLAGAGYSSAEIDDLYDDGTVV